MKILNELKQLKNRNEIRGLKLLIAKRNLDKKRELATSTKQH